MITIKELLNKVKWDAREKSEDYLIYYLDMDKLKELKYEEIMRFEGTFMVIGADETYIPLHRVRKVKKKLKCIWERS